MYDELLQQPTSEQYDLVVYTLNFLTEQYMERGLSPALVAICEGCYDSIYY